MLLWLAAAPAQDSPEPPMEPGAARLCAEAADGTEVEVCLKLAAAHPDQVDEVAAALGAHVDRGSSADRELMFALLLLLAEPTGPQGASALGELGDPRAVPPLIHAVQTRELPVALASTRALGRYRAGIPALAAWLLDRERPLELRVQAARTLGDMPWREASDALVDGLRRRGLPPLLRRTMLEVVRDRHPDRTHELTHQISRDGTTWVSVGTSLSLGYAMAAAGRFSEPEIAGLGAVAGAVAGGTVGYLGGRALPVEADDASFVFVNGAVGTAVGLSLGAGLAPGSPDAASWAGLAGEAVGLTGGVLLAGVHPGSPADSLEAAALGLALGGALGGALDVGARNGLSDPDGDRPALVGLGVGLGLGTVLGHAIAPNIRFERNDWAMVTLAGLTGTALGAAAPLAGNARGALPAVGGAAGVLAGFALAGSVDPDWDALGSGALGAGYGALVVGGAAAWAAPDDRQLIGGVSLLGGLAGLGVGGLLADLDQDPIEDRDLVLMGMATAWTVGLTAGVQTLATGDPLDRVGPLLTLPAGAGALVAAASPVLDVPVTHSSAAFSLGMWGAYVGGSAGALIDDAPIVGALVGGNVALVTGAACLSPFIGMTPTTVAAADAGGLLGAGIGLATANALRGDTDTLLIGSLIGAGVGFGTGSAVGSWLRRTGATRSVAWAPRLPGVRVDVGPALVRGARSDSMGVRLQVNRW